MNRIIILFLFIFFSGSIFQDFADTKKQKNIKPDDIVITTWSKIKELFE